MLLRAVQLCVALSLAAAVLTGCGDHQATALKRLSGKGYSLSVAEFVRAARAGDDEAVRWFVEAGVEPSLADSQHHTALTAAVEAGRRPVVEALMKLGVQLPTEGKAAADLLCGAVKSRNQDLLRYLIDHRVTDRGLSSESESPLIVAAGLGQREAVELLLPFAEGKQQQALYAAATGGDVASLSLLIRAGASLWTVNPASGKTALMLAAEAGKAEAVELLFNAGSNRWTLDHEGRSARDLAAATANHRVISLLNVRPTTDEMESGVKRLNGLSLEIGAANNNSVEELFHLRSCREETLPFVLQGVLNDAASFRLTSSKRVQTVAAKGALGDSDWYLSHIETGEGQSPEWWWPLVTLRNSKSGQRLQMVVGVPGRAGKTLAVLEFLPTREIFEGQPGDVFTLAANPVRQFIVDQILPLSVTFHDKAKPETPVVIRAGAAQ